MKGEGKRNTSCEVVFWRWIERTEHEVVVEVKWSEPGERVNTPIRRKEDEEVNEKGGRHDDDGLMEKGGESRSGSHRHNHPSHSPFSNLKNDCNSLLSLLSTFLFHPFQLYSPWHLSFVLPTFQLLGMDPIILMLLSLETDRRNWEKYSFCPRSLICVRMFVCRMIAHDEKK